MLKILRKLIGTAFLLSGTLLFTVGTIDMSNHILLAGPMNFWPPPLQLYLPANVIFALLALIGAILLRLRSHPLVGCGMAVVSLIIINSVRAYQIAGLEIRTLTDDRYCPASFENYVSSYLLATIVMCIGLSFIIPVRKRYSLGAFLFLGCFASYRFFYTGILCSSRQSPDNRYTVETYALRSLCSNPDIGYVRLKDRHGSVIRELESDIERLEVQWDIQNDLVQVTTYIDRVYWSLDSAGNTSQTPLYHQHRLNLSVLNEDTTEAFAELGRGANINGRDDNGDTALMAAALRLNFKMVRFLLEQGASIDPEESNSDYVQKIIHQAAMYGDIELLKNLEAKGIDLSAGLARRAPGSYPLHDSAYFGRLQAVSFLLDHDFNINETDEQGRTPIAVIKNALSADGDFGERRKEMVKTANYLIERGATPVKAIGTGEALWNMAGKGSCEEIEEIINAGADVHYKHDLGYKVETPLVRAIWTANDEGAICLIRYGAELTSPGEDNESLIPMAASNGMAEFIEELANRRADLNAIDSSGFSALARVDQTIGESSGKVPEAVAKLKKVKELLESSGATAIYPSGHNK